MKNRHSVIDITLHLVLVTKYRKLFAFESAVLESAVTSSGCILEKIGIANNHVHLLISVPSTRTVSKVAEIIKSTSSRRFMNLFPSTWPGWQTGFYVSSVGRSSKNKVKQYLEEQ
jgi:REP element-mobilizing transposase RayT